MSAVSPCSISYAASTAWTLICCFVILCAASPSDCLHQRIKIIVCCTAWWRGLFSASPCGVHHSSINTLSSFKWRNSIIWFNLSGIISPCLLKPEHHRDVQGCLLCPRHCDIIVPTDHTWRETFQRISEQLQDVSLLNNTGGNGEFCWSDVHISLDLVCIRPFWQRTPPWPPLAPLSPHSPLSNLTDLHDVGCHSLAPRPPVHLFPIV